MAPTSLRVGRTAALTFSVPCERDDATTAAIRIVLPPELRLDRGDTRWRGAARAVVKLVVRVTPSAAGDVAVPVVQTYSDGEIVRWSGGASSDDPAPVVHVEAAQTANRDRVIILALVAAVAAAAFALRRKRGQRN